MTSSEDRNRPEQADAAPDAQAAHYAAFVSYSHAPVDRRWAEWLHRSLETYRTPEPLVKAGKPRRLGRVFRDEEELGAASDLSQRIDAALKRARFLIVVCSPRTPASAWVDKEIRRFQGLESPARVLALLIEGEPAVAFPPALRASEPLAADVRPRAGQRTRALKRTALLKLVAEWLDGSYDTLRQRDDERARRRLAALAAGLGAAAVAFLGLAAFAVQQWSRAEGELRVSRAQTLAVHAQVANTAAANPDDPIAPDRDRGILLALESLATHPTVEADRALRTGLRPLGRPALDTPVGESDELAGIGSNGAWLLIRNENDLRILDLDSGASRAATPGEIQSAGATAVEHSQEVEARSRDGSMVARTSREGGEGGVAANVEVLREGRRVALLPHEWPLSYAAFSADARHLVTVTGRVSADASEPSATALVGSTVRVWEVASGRKHTEVSLADEGGIAGVALSPEGDWLATVVPGPEGTVVRLWPLWPELA